MPTVTNNQLAAMVRRYHTKTDKISALEKARETLRVRIVKAMTAKDQLTFTVDTLTARRGTRVTRTYRLTTTLAKLLERARVEAFIPSGPIDAAIKAKKLSAAKVTPFAVGSMTPTFGVYSTKDGDA